MEWFITCFSIAGVILNIRKSKICFIIWTFTNASWMVVDFIRGIYSQSFLFFIYFILAIYGLYKWAKDEKHES